MGAAKRMLPMGVALGVLGALAFAGPALANTRVATCQLNATASMAPSVPLTGGTGTYTLDIAARCAGTDGSTSTAAVWTVDLTSNGTYLNTVCGTGALDSTGNAVGATATLAGDPAIAAGFAAAIPAASYHIAFSTGLGNFSWRAGSAITGNGGGTDGWVTVTPVFDDNPPACTKHFTLTGAITGRFA